MKIPIQNRYYIRHGLSMLEVIVSLVLVTSIVLVSLNASANMMRNRVLSKQGVSAQQLAGFLLDEISVRDYEDEQGSTTLGLDTGEIASNRSTYDDIDDYHGFSEITPRFRDGTLIPGYANWRVQASVSPLISSGRSLFQSTDLAAPLRLITVSVTTPDTQVHSFRTIVSNAATDRPASNSFERLRRIKVTFSSDRSMDLVIPLRNTPPPQY